MLISGKDLLANFSMEDIAELVDINPSLRGYLHGYLAEKELQKQLLQIDGVTSVTKIPDRSDRKGDFDVVYNGRSFTIEVKSLSSHSLREDTLNGGWVGNVSLKRTDREYINEIESTYAVVRGEFDILAICNFSLTKEWDFQFIANKYLPGSEQYPDRLSTKLTINTINTPKLTSNILEVFSEF